MDIRFDDETNTVSCGPTTIQLYTHDIFLDERFCSPQKYLDFYNSKKGLSFLVNCNGETYVAINDDGFFTLANTLGPCAFTLKVPYQENIKEIDRILDFYKKVADGAINK